MLTYQPSPGQILMCDFTVGFKEPEIVKNRPVLVLTPSMAGRGGLVTVVALSTSMPTIVQKYHLKLPKASLPMLPQFQQQDTWIKGDMIYAVGFHRLNLIMLGARGPDGKRQYFSQKLGRERMREAYGCVLHGLNLGALCDHIPK